MVDKRTTAILVLLSTWVFFAYYTVWILVTPTLDEDFWLQNYFPDRMYGIFPTSLLAYIILAYMFTFTGIALITDTNSTPILSTTTPKEEQVNSNSNPNEAVKTKQD